MWVKGHAIDVRTRGGEPGNETNRHLVCDLHFVGLLVELAQEYFYTSFFEPEQPVTYISCPYSYLVKSGRGPEEKCVICAQRPNVAGQSRSFCHIIR